MPTVVLGMSDGVDSAVAALLLKKQGYAVYGLFLDTGIPNAPECALESAKRLSIPLKIHDARAELETIVCEPFRSAYCAGRTPSPCISCNPLMKFRLLAEYADKIGAKYIATGHYSLCDGRHIYTGHPSCDQSYMLARLLPGQVARLLLPLGAYAKKQVREIADEVGLPVAEKPDSRENCFIRGMHYIEWIESRGEVPPEGALLFQGREIGRHRGIHRYTVGQRWHETMGGRRLYISSIDVAANTVTLALWEDTFRSEIDVSDCSWIAEEPPASFRAVIRARHTRWEMPTATVTKCGASCRVVTDEPLRAPAPGQALAMYDGNMLLGGGWIA
ncbi:MAG: tRNA-specific 2-thiouridylase [Christensenellales bacterium]